MGYKAMKLLTASCVTLALTAATAHGAEKVTIGEHDWDGGLALMHVMKVVLEDRLGIDVDTVAVSQEAMIAAMDKGDGSVDVLPDLYIPNRNELWAKYIAEGSNESVVTNSKPYAITQGLFIPGYIQDEYKIDSVADLLKPEISTLFDSDGDGKGEFWGGPTGWGSTNVERVKAKSYGYDKLLTQVETGDAILKARLKAAYAKKEPILFYFWMPESIFAMYDLRRLEEPPFDGFSADTMKGDPDYNPSGCWKMYQPKDRPDWLEASNVKCVWPDSRSYVAYSKSLEKRAPNAAKFFSQVYFDSKWVNDWILKLSVDKEDPTTMVRDWMKANPGVVDQWVSGIK